MPETKFDWNQIVYQSIPSEELKEFNFQNSADWVAGKLLDLAVFHKHSGYSEEEEWRWAASFKLSTPAAEPDTNTETVSNESPSDDDGNIFEEVIQDLLKENRKRVQFRKGKYGLTPYIEMDFDNQKSIIREIVIGPRVDSELATVALREFKRLRSLEFSIRHSQIPYR